MEFIFEKKEYRQKFVELSKIYKEDFSEFCNLLINDMNSLLFDGLLALEEIRNYEMMRENDHEWNQLDNEQRE